MKQKTSKLSERHEPSSNHRELSEQTTSASASCLQPFLLGVLVSYKCGIPWSVGSVRKACMTQSISTGSGEIPGTGAVPEQNWSHLRRKGNGYAQQVLSDIADPQTLKEAELFTQIIQHLNSESDERIKANRKLAKYTAGELRSHQSGHHLPIRPHIRRNRL